MHGIGSSERIYVMEIFAEVFRRIGEKDSETLILKRNVQFVIPVSSTATPFFINPFMADNRPEFGGMIPVWLISLSPDLIRGPRHEFMYTVAHELAHALLEHGSGDMSEQELEADSQVLKWGFKEELKKTPFNYLTGDGLSNWGLK